MSEVTKVRLREEIPEKYKWAIEEMYADMESFEKDFAIVKEEGPKLKEFQGKLSDGKELLKYLKKDEEVSRIADQLFVFSNLKLDENTQVSESQSLKKRMDAYMNELSTIKSFFVPEILSIGKENLEKEIAENPELKLYEFHFENILRNKPHVLDKEKEELLSNVSDAFGAPESIWGMLINADLVFPKIKGENGEEIQLTDTNFNTYLRSKNRDVRRDAFEGAFGAFRNYKNTFAGLVTSSIKNFANRAKVKNYKNSLEFALKPDNIPVEVYHTTLDTIHKNLHHLHKYVELKKKALGVEQMHMYDMYMPLVDKVEDNIPYEEGIELILKGLAPLGEEYLDIFKKGINNRWVDVYENKGKKGGAYSWGTYDTTAYVHVNYGNHYNDISMVAHEMGHSIHSYYSNANQPYIYSFYTYFSAEVASTTNESLLINYLINAEKDKNKKMFYIAALLDQMRIVVFRQALFTEFEHIVHVELENGNILSADDLCKIYHELNVKYYGESIVVDEAVDMEWARIPQYFMDYYTYQYVTGFAAANSFSKGILDEGKPALDKYLQFLKGGCSDYSIELLKKAGVDMTSPKPLQDTMDIFAEKLNMLEELLNE